MVEFDEKGYELKLKAFKRECDRVRPRKGTNQTTNVNLKQDYKKSLVETYNELLKHIFRFLAHVTVEGKIDLQLRARTNCDSLKKAFEHLKFSYPFENGKFGTIDINKITENTDSERSEQVPEQINLNANSQLNDQQSQLNNSLRSQPDVSNGNLDNLSDSEDRTEDDKTNSVNNTDNSSDSEASEAETEFEMAQTIEKFMALANQMISFRYNGDPLNLDSFIDSVELLKDFCDPQNAITRHRTRGNCYNA